MELPERSESKNPLQEDTNFSKGESHSFLSYLWTTPSLRDNKQQRIKLKQSPDVIEDNESGYRMSIQGMSNLNMINGEVVVKGITDQGKDLLFTGYSVYFSWSVFFEEFFVNLLNPFTCWVNPYMHSWNDFSSFLGVVYVHGTPIMIILLIISSYMAGDIDDGEYVLPLMMLILHKVAVALKYASLFPEEYSKLTNARDHATVKSYQQQLQMIASWLGQNLVVMEHEIKCAAAVSGSDIDHTMLVLPTEDEEAKAYCREGDDSQFVTWRNFLLENGCDIDTLPQNNAGNRVITVHEFVRILLNESNKHSYGRRIFDRGMMVFMLVLIFVPFMYRGFSHSGSESQQGWGHFADALSITVTPFVLVTNLLLLFVPIYDVSRRKKLAKLLNYITTVSTIRAERKNFLPVIDMFKAQNVYGWMYTRLVIQSYGKRMLDRIDNFISTYIVVVTIFTIYLIVSLFTSDGNPFDGNSYVVQFCLLTLLVLSMICTQVYLASQVNMEFDQHKINVVLNEMKANSQLLYAVELQDEMMTRGEEHTEAFRKLQTEKFRLEEAMKAMKRVVEAIAISNEQNPLCVLGMRADMSILISIMTAIATLLSSIITVAMRSRSGYYED